MNEVTLPKPLVVLHSFGMSCQTACQLAQYARKHPGRVSFAKGPVDWWICPPASLSKWLDEGMPVFEPGEIQIRRGCAYWERFDIYFYHGFLLEQQHPWWWCIRNALPYRIRKRIHSKPPRLDINSTFDREMSKLRYQCEKLRCLDVRRTQFFVSNTQNNLETAIFQAGDESKYHFTEEAMEELGESLNRFFGVPVQLHCVTGPNRATQSLIDRKNSSSIGPDKSEWSGDDEAWTRVIEQCLAE